MVKRTTALCAALALGACRDASPAGQGSAPPSATGARDAGVPPSPASASSAAAVSSTPEPRQQAGPRTPTNVLLVVIDSLRADVVRERGPEVTPWLSVFSKRAVTYSRAYSISSATARSVAGLLAGRYPSEMIRNGYFFTRWYPENHFFTEHLRTEGHATLGAFAHAYFFPGTGIDQGFSDSRVLPGTFLNNTTKDNVTGERLHDLAKQMLSKAAAGEKPFFAYVHFMDPHSPYLPHEGRPHFGTQPRDYYLQEVHYTDEWAGKLVDWSLEQPWGPRTTVIVTADHGESFGEHGHLKHGYELWEELVRVPWVIAAPGAPPRVVDEPRGHIDLAPTVLDLMGAPVDPPLRGVSLVSELFGAAPAARPVVLDLPRDDLQDRRRALIDGREKIIEVGDGKAHLLYDVVADPRERRDLSKDRERVSRMKRRLEAASDTIEALEYRGKEVPLRGAPPGRRW